MRKIFPFINKDFELIAEVDDKSGKQCLTIRHNPSGDSDSINCIHTAVMDVSLDDFEHMNEDDIKQKIVSSEGMEINLEPEEKFKAFKSWTAGIAEAGVDAFKLQSEIEGLNEFQTPISSPLLKFVAKHDDEFFDTYLRKIEKECQFEGIKHDPCMMANLESLAQVYCEFEMTDNCKKIMDIYPDAVLKNSDVLVRRLTFNNFDDFLMEIERVCKSNDSCMMENLEPLVHVYCEFETDNCKKIMDFYPDAVLKSPYIDDDVKELMKSSLNKIFSDDYLMDIKAKCQSKGLQYESCMMKNLDSFVRSFCENDAMNYKMHDNCKKIIDIYPDAVFKNNSEHVRESIAYNEYAVQFPEYRQLFNDNDSDVRIAVAYNEYAVQFPEYRQLFNDKDDVVRYSVAYNKNAVQFSEFKKFLNDENPVVKKGIAFNENAVQFPEYRKLFNDKDPWVRNAVAHNLNAVQFPEYRQLFDDKEALVRNAVAYNQNAVQFPEFENLLNDEDERVSENARSTMEKVKNLGSDKYADTKRKR